MTAMVMVADGEFVVAGGDGAVAFEPVDADNTGGRPGFLPTGNNGSNRAHCPIREPGIARCGALTRNAPGSTPASTSERADANLTTSSVSSAANLCSRWLRSSAATWSQVCCRRQGGKDPVIAAGISLTP